MNDTHTDSEQTAEDQAAIVGANAVSIPYLIGRRIMKLNLTSSSISSRGL